MERIIQRCESAKKSLASLEEVLNLEKNTIVRGASIQRFEYTLEAMWKLAQNYLNQYEGIDLASPKGVLRSCFEVGLVPEVDAGTLLQMIDDRNLTVHLYNELIAEQIFQRLNLYQVVLTKLYNSIVSKIPA